MSALNVLTKHHISVMRKLQAIKWCETYDVYGIASGDGVGWLDTVSDLGGRTDFPTSGG